MAPFCAILVVVPKQHLFSNHFYSNNNYFKSSHAIPHSRLEDPVHRQDPPMFAGWTHLQITNIGLIILVLEFKHL